MAVDVAGVVRWLVDVEHVEDGGESFAAGLAERLAGAGVAVWRLSFALLTKHPEVLWRTVQWKDGVVVARDQPHARLLEAFYTESAVARARESGERVRVKLVDGALAYPVAVELRDEGATDYCVEPLAYAGGQRGYVAFATRAESGFSEEQLAALAELRPHLARRIELLSSYHATRALLEVYLGKNASRRVFAGAFQRGAGELIDAAIWFSDMRDFTALSDERAPAEVIAVLDGYFDAVASAISSRGGEVLKFIGDAVLAIFPVGDDPMAACRRALAAAEEAFAAIEEKNRERVGRGEPAVSIGVALHRGEVMYGNIGARDRLDFTVISSAVNEASRLEGLCKQLGTHLALSESFRRTAALPAADLVDLGEHALKGVKARVRVFTLRSSGSSG
jgi:adenylate cyclase